MEQTADSNTARKRPVVIRIYYRVRGEPTEHSIINRPSAQGNIAADACSENVGPDPNVSESIFAGPPNYR
jgi:hypothetical protein